MQASPHVKFYRWHILTTSSLNTRNQLAVSSSITTPLGPPPPNCHPHPPFSPCHPQHHRPPPHKTIVLTWPPMGGRGEVSPTSSAWQTLSIPPPALIISTIIVIINIITVIIVSIPPPALIIYLSAPSSVHHHHYIPLSTSLDYHHHCFQLSNSLNLFPALIWRFCDVCEVVHVC